MGETARQQALYRLTTLLSPAFPTGAFAWSGGLETACASGAVHDSDSLEVWLNTALTHGFLKTDAVLFAAAFRDTESHAEIDALSRALVGSAAREEETSALAKAFLAAAGPWLDESLDAASYPVAVAMVARKLDLDLQDSLTAYLQSAISNQLQAALRLMPLGQRAATALLARLEPYVIEASAIAATSTLDELGTCAFLMDSAAMQHDTLPVRLFRS